MTTRDLPIDLDYDDPHAPALHPASVLGAARRLRRNRRAGVAAALAAVVALLAAVVPGVLGGPGAPPDPLAAARADSFVRANPPLGDLTIIGREPEHWTTIVWISQRFSMCKYSVETPPRSPGSGGCEPGFPDDLLTNPASTLFSKPLFDPGLPDPGDTHAIGYVRGPAKTVEVTMFGRTVSAQVVPLPVGGATQIGAYFIRLPTEGHSEYGWDDITMVVARDAAGLVIARIP